MKKENFSAEKLKVDIEEWLDSLDDNPDFQYKRKYKDFAAGDANPTKIKKEKERYAKTLAALDYFAVFEEKKAALERFDFEDMLQWVISAFENDPVLLEHYQQQFEYVLVDEFQDTNGVQSRILELLTDYEQPNVFIVGDDDQSIFRFQGANLNNFNQFIARFKGEVSTVILKENYRSTAAVLDASAILIENNEQRLVHNMDLKKALGAQLSKRLHANKKDNAPVQLCAFNNDRAEEAFILDYIEKHKASGGKYSDIALIYSTHRHVADLQKVMVSRGIPFKAKREQSILGDYFMGKLMRIFRYFSLDIGIEDRDAELFFILHYSSFGLDVRDIVQLATYRKNAARVEKGIYKKRSWEDLLYGSLTNLGIEFHNQAGLEAFAERLKSWQRLAITAPIEEFFYTVLEESGLYNELLCSKIGRCACKW